MENDTLMNPPETDPVPAIAYTSFWDWFKVSVSKAVDTGLEIWKRNSAPYEGTPGDHWLTEPNTEQFGPPSPIKTVKILGYPVPTTLVLIGGGLGLWWFLRRRRK